MTAVMLDILINCWLVLGEMAPYLLLGFAIAGAMSVLVSAAWVGRHLGGGGLWPTVKATVLGVPLPLCSCGVIPVSAGLRRQGAGRGPTSAFLLATPETGVDSILATYALLGPVFAIVRPVVALIGGIVCGMMVNLFGEKDAPAAAPPVEACCGDGGTDACSTAPPQGNRFMHAARYGFITLPRDIAVHLLIGVAIAGALMVLIAPGVAERWLGGGLGSMLAMMVIGLPLYVCATGSIPLAVAFMHMGASPGAALVFLIAGPATNAATLTVTWKLLGKRSAIVYLLVVATTALGAGYLIDLLWTPAALMLPDIAHAHGGEAVGPLEHLAAATLLTMLIASFHFSRRTASRSASAAARPNTTRTVLNVEGMTCSHCAATVARTLQQLAGVTAVEVDLDARHAVVEAADVEPADLVGAIEQLGYRAAVQRDD